MTSSVALEQKLMQFYARFVPEGIPHPQPAQVVRMYGTDVEGLNQALFCKYGADLEEVSQIGIP